RLGAAAELKLAGPPAGADAAARQEYDIRIREAFQDGRRLLDRALDAWQAARDEWAAQYRRFPDDGNAVIFGQGAARAGGLLEAFAAHATPEQLESDPHSFQVRVRSVLQYDLLVKPFMNLEPRIHTVEP
ncbi:MAG TPA: hypothetical protein PLP01_16585, partial [Phycisphaerae bacterium]|nr:hypothetical protein [Phycisphaerae bacterium]